MKLLKELCESAGIPGREDRLRHIVRRELKPLVDDLRIDALGNLIAVKRANRKRSPRKLMIAAHMDEIGFVVSHIDDRGLLRLVPLGGHDPRNMVAQRVTVSGTKRDLSGLLYPGIKPPHIQKVADRDKPLEVSDFIVDVYLPAAKVKREVEIGSMVTLQRDFAEIGDGISCKAMDDRIALYVMIRAMQKADSFGCETWAVATVQEEIGLRGAQASAYGIEPDMGVALDVTVAADLPSIPAHEQVTRLGEGVAIKLMDSSAISHPGIVAHMKSLAKKRNIKYQLEILPRGGTDAGAMQRIRAGVPVATISVPTRYIHTSVELVDRGDLQAAVELMTALIEEGQKADLDLI